jgi:hypothetical protein
MRSLIVILGILCVTGLVVVPLVQAAETATVTATVTVQNISVSVSDGSVAYGAMALNTSKSTCDLSDTQTVTNDGNVTEDFNIKGQNSANWTLGSTPGNNQYVHKFSTSSCPWSSGTALTTSYLTLATGIAPSGTTTLNLQITTPTSTSSYDQQSVDVTVQAISS